MLPRSGRGYLLREEKGILGRGPAGARAPGCGGRPRQRAGKSGGASGRGWVPGLVKAPCSFGRALGVTDRLKQKRDLSLTWPPDLRLHSGCEWEQVRTEHPHTPAFALADRGDLSMASPGLWRRGPEDLCGPRPALPRPARGLPGGAQEGPLPWCGRRAARVFKLTSP